MIARVVLLVPVAEDDYIRHTAKILSIGGGKVLEIDCGTLP